MALDPGPMLARIRADAEAPGALFVILRASGRRVALEPKEIIGKTDEELLAHVMSRLTEE